MRLVAEGFSNGHKAAVVDKQSYFVNEETIRINGETLSIIVNNDIAHVENVEEADIYRALYPASLNGSATLASDNVNVTIPSTHTYSEDANGRQVLDVPMAAYSTDYSRLVLQHITAALIVEITNSLASEVTVDSIIVGSDHYQLAGSKDITLSSSLAVTAEQSDVASDKSVTMRCNGATSLTIPVSQTKSIQIPVLPVGSGNHFSVTVAAHIGSDKYVFTYTQPSGGDLPRKYVGYVPVTLSASGDNVYSGSDIISTTSEYTTMAAFVSSKTSGTYKYVIDGIIDFNNSAITPITVKPGVTLVINGINNATIKNTTVSAQRCGLVGDLDGNLIVNNLTIENMQATWPSSDSHFGAFCAYAFPGSTLQLNNCISKDPSLSGTYTKNNYFGGLVGHNNNTSVSLNQCQFICDNALSIHAARFGGLIANILSTSYVSITNCCVSKSNGNPIDINVTMNAEKNVYVGGMVGNLPSNAFIQSNTCNANISVSQTNADQTNCFAGGFIGYIYNNVTLTGNLNSVNGSVTISTTASTTSCEGAIGKTGSNVTVPVDFFSSNTVSPIVINGVTQ